MLLYFKTSNNLSFQNEVEFSMVAGNFTEHKENIIPIEKYKINALKSSVIYGANASGKSNLLKSIANGVEFIQDSFTSTKVFDVFSNHFNKNNEINQTIPSKYVFGILIDGIQFEYSFSLDRERIIEEELIEYRTQKPIYHFKRFYDKIEKIYKWAFSNHFTGKKDTVKEITNSRTLFLTVGAFTELPIAIKVLDWFRENIRWSIDFFSPGKQSIDFTLKWIKRNPEFKSVVLEYLQEADFTIIDLIIEEDDFGLEAKTFHKTIDLNGNESISKFDLSTQESAGTNRFIAWIGIWIDVLLEGKTLLIDELGTSMHTLLSQHLINLFHKQNKHQSQLIFTTHDTNLMTQEIFRRDQIWIVEKDRLGNSELYSLSDFKIKKGKVLENSYLQGVYGGIPHIQATKA